MCVCVCMSGHGGEVLVLSVVHCWLWYGYSCVYVIGLWAVGKVFVETFATYIN